VKKFFHVFQQFIKDKIQNQLPCLRAKGR